MKAEYESLKAKIDSFNGWTVITFTLNTGAPSRVLRDKNQEKTQAWLDSGLLEEAPFDPSYVKHIVNGESPEFVDQFIWLRPTTLGLACYHLYQMLNDQKRATKEAYTQGKQDAATQIASKVASFAGVTLDLIQEEQ